MTHFGILCPPATGHFNTMIPLGKELQNRGHNVTYFGFLDTQSKILAAGLGFVALGVSDYPLGTIPISIAFLGNLSGLNALNYTIKLAQKEIKIFFQEAPLALKNAGIEALLIDQATPQGGTIAQIQSIPFITVCSALLMNEEGNIPPSFTNWKYSSTKWAFLRNKTGYLLLKNLLKPITHLINQNRHFYQLPLYKNYPNDFDSKLAILSQQPIEFEFPRTNLPTCFHFTGPYHSYEGREAVPFPWHKLTGQRLIYASLGTSQNRLAWIFQKIVEACEGIEAQLIISLGGSRELESSLKVSGNTIITQFAPQLELLKKATLTITHAGLNTVLESLSAGVPMIAIPIANDQPGVAARIAWTKTGQVIPLSLLNVTQLRAAIKHVLNEDSYKQNVLRLQAAIQRAGGVSYAADVVEKAISNN